MCFLCLHPKNVEFSTPNLYVNNSCKVRNPGETYPGVPQSLCSHYWGYMVSLYLPVSPFRCRFLVGPPRALSGRLEYVTSGTVEVYQFEWTPNPTRVTKGSHEPPWCRHQELCQLFYDDDPRWRSLRPKQLDPIPTRRHKTFREVSSETTSDPTLRDLVYNRLVSFI